MSRGLINKAALRRKCNELRAHKVHVTGDAIAALEHKIMDDLIKAADSMSECNRTTIMERDIQ